MSPIQSHRPFTQEINRFRIISQFSKVSVNMNKITQTQTRGILIAPCDGRKVVECHIRCFSLVLCWWNVWGLCWMGILVRRCAFVGWKNIKRWFDVKHKPSHEACLCQVYHYILQLFYFFHSHYAENNFLHNETRVWKRIWLLEKYIRMWNFSMKGFGKCSPRANWKKKKCLSKLFRIHDTSEIWFNN